MDDFEYRTPRDDGEEQQQAQARAQREELMTIRSYYAECIGDEADMDDDNDDQMAWSTPLYVSAASDCDYQTPREFSDSDTKAVHQSSQQQSKQSKESTRTPSVSSSKAVNNSSSSKMNNKSKSTTTAKSNSNLIPSVSSDIYSDDKWLLSNDVSRDQIEEIFSYARHGRCENMEALLAQGIPVDVRDEHGNTLLAISCQNGNKKVAKCLLRRGAAINCRNHKGNTPLHFCFHFGYGESLGQYLIDKGADPSIKNNLGKHCWDGI